MNRVINFSGGKTSALMTILEYKVGDLVIFCDTGREHKKTYKFINDFEAFENIPVIRLSLDGSKNPFDTLLIKKKYKIIPNRMKRICTVELKIRVAKRYLRSIGIRRFENLVGFRSDEPRRVLGRKQEFKNVIDKFPLYERGITKKMVNEFWSKKPYNLEIPPILGNCDLCFMKGKNAIINIMRLEPELADKWIHDEEMTASNGDKKAHRYFPDITYKELLEISKRKYFKQLDLFDIQPAFNCACTSI